MKVTIIFICLFLVFTSAQAGLFDTFPGTSAFPTNIQGTAYTPGTGELIKKTISVFGYEKNEIPDYSTQEIGNLDIKPLQKGIQFKSKLTVEQYQILIKDWLNNIYEDKFESNAWVLKYFIRALAEMSFSNNGYLSIADFNSIREGFENYRKADNCISKLEVSSRIKYSLAKLFAAGCVYTRYIEKEMIEESIDMIKKIPKDVVLYVMEEQSAELMQKGKGVSSSDSPLLPVKDQNAIIPSQLQLGNFIGYDHGENLYYICMSYYDNFKNLTREQQIKIINRIYSYNPTLMVTPPIKRKNFLWDYIKDYFFPVKNPEVMKYCVRGYVNWVLLPKSI